jgi:hypothetical protein
VAFALFALGAWTLVVGPVEITAGGVRVLRNSSYARPWVASVLLLWATGHVGPLVRMASVTALIALLPTDVYLVKLGRTASYDRPVAAVRDCLARPNGPGRLRRGVLSVEPHSLPHTYYYYLRHVGPFQAGAGDLDEELRRRLFGRTGQSTPVIMPREAWKAARLRFGLEPPTDEHLTMSPLDLGLEFPDGRVILMPPDYVPCLEAAIAAGGVRLAWHEASGGS